MKMIKETWEKIEEDSRKSGSGGFLSRLLPGKFTRDYSLAMKMPEGESMFYFQVEENTLPVKADLPGAAGFRVDIGKFHGDQKPSLIIVLQDEDFKDVFSTFLEDMVSSLEMVKSDKECVTVLINRLSTWKSFMKVYQKKGLTPEQQRGLFGELHVLGQLLISRFGSRMVDAWVGPDGATQDFQFDGTAVEVKTTVQKKPQHISISNERQLDKGTLDTLVLANISVDENAATGMTLKEKVNEIKDLLGDSVPSQVRFTERLYLVGYNDLQADHYDKSYDVRSTSLYSVEDDFPKIVADDLMDGVGNIRYSVTIDVCTQYLLTEEEFYQSIDERNN